MLETILIGTLVFLMLVIASLIVGGCYILARISWHVYRVMIKELKDAQAKQHKTWGE